MYHDMTGPAIMAGRLGARTFACPLRGLLAMDYSLRDTFSRPLFGLKPGSFGTFIS